jgi:hypothetical protein
VAIADTFHGPWTVLGDLHPKDASRTSFNSQVSSVFKHPAKKDLYIALADRWMPDLPQTEGAGFASGDAYRRFEPMFAKMFNPDGPALTPAEGAELKGQAERINTSRAPMSGCHSASRVTAPLSTGAARGVRTTSPDGDVLNEGPSAGPEKSGEKNAVSMERSLPDAALARSGEHRPGEGLGPDGRWRAAFESSPRAG